MAINISVGIVAVLGLVAIAYAIVSVVGLVRDKKN